MNDNNDRKFLFFIGKGGVGKSTVSSLTAIELSKNKSVLLVSLDPAHNLSDIFQTQLNTKPKNIIPNLSVLEINISEKIKKYLSEVENDLIKSNTYLSAFNLLEEFKILKDSPGIEEYGILIAFQDILTKYSDKEIIIFDMPPTALALKFFKLPSISLIWINKLISLRTKIKEKKEIVSRIKLGNVEVEKDKILLKLNKQQEDYKKTEEIFRSKKTEINLVINTDILSHSEAESIIEKLNEVSVSVENVILNKSNPNFYLENESLLKYKIQNINLSEKVLVGIKNLQECLSL
ncbi:MAG: TRC40/GET3/ArsA family transport-energizing ATPase [Arcobacter sp.]|nr:TRC40/GET3/ArsA family transport-energizing ATPase [Arcobacter sp.]